MTEAAQPALLAVDAALALILAQAQPLPAEAVPLAESAGRYLATDISAALDLPPFRAAALDGFAVRHADTPGRLRIVGESAAGSPHSRTLAQGEAVLISTGAVIPYGADAVVPVEWVPDASPDAITVRAHVDHQNAIREPGSDVTRGTVTLAKGTRITPARIGAAAALGLSSLPCSRRPSVSLLATGSELRDPGEDLGPGQIYNSNGPMLRSALAGAGASVTALAAAADTGQQHRQALALALAGDQDVLISTGGVSMGGHDLVRVVLAELGVRELFWKVAMKPGKPLSFGVRERPDGRRTLVFGVPGNPVSALVCFALFVRPALAALQGAADPGPHYVPATLASSLRRDPGRDQLIRVRRGREGELEPLRGQQSHQLAELAASDGLARIPAGGGELAAGSCVDYLPLL
jgi:molybdopterin molybdotransferase